MRIDKDLLVRLHYTLNEIGEDGEKAFVEKTNEDEPLTFILGTGMMLPAFERALLGLSVGDHFDFTLAPEDAYGASYPELKMRLAKELFLVDGEFDSEMVQEGAYVPMRTDDGTQVEGLVLEVGEDEVVLDFNHPMADATLAFEGEIVEVREPSEEEYNEMLAPMSGGCGCGCGCDSDDDEEEGCGCSSGGCGCH